MSKEAMKFWRKIRKEHPRCLACGKPDRYIQPDSPIVAQRLCSNCLVLVVGGIDVFSQN